ncbi:hypothetical protein F4778DRAFT_732158 [Xylariomycetidae sp. FL2044]|nr:hypothetical protein F4778DRAFT_732158 [Xylariomycetidae sp. FL2044]
MASRTDWVAASTPGRYSWVSSPDIRGTMDIVWPCLTTVALCLWSMLHLNLPGPDDTDMTEFWRRLRWSLLGVLCPELPMLFAFSQLSSARQSVEDMKKVPDHPEWTITHGFYADSGGFVLDVVGSANFPVTAKQMVFLVRNGYIDRPSITQADIKDKSKADGLAKGLAFFQSAWLMTKFIGRAIQGLDTSPFELASAALILCSLASLCLWWHKPLNVRAPTIVQARTDIASILAAAGDGVKYPFADTPLDFVESDLYWSRKWTPAIFRQVLQWGLQTRPLNRTSAPCLSLSKRQLLVILPLLRSMVAKTVKSNTGIPNDRDFQPANLMENVYLGIPVCIFSAIHFLGWNLDFPTDTELSLWRINCIIVWVSLGVYGVSEMVGFRRASYRVGSLELFDSYKKRMPGSMVFLALGFLYFASRLCLLVEAIISLRDLPESAFSDVSWTQFVPQL